MSTMVGNIFFWIKATRFLCHILLFKCHKDHDLLLKERNQWILLIMKTSAFTLKNHLWLLIYVKEYRSVFYLRLGKIAKLLKFYSSGRESLYINMESSKVGEGLIVQHGFSTIVEAIRIGANCQIWQNVTIGTNISGSGNKAIIGDNVKISAGAIVLGKITIGNNTTIGAGCVVVKNVPDNCVVVGNPAMIVKRDGIRTRESL